jgi:hypothetical protein
MITQQDLVAAFPAFGRMFRLLAEMEQLLQNVEEAANDSDPAVQAEAIALLPLMRAIMQKDRAECAVLERDFRAMAGERKQ